MQINYSKTELRYRRARRNVRTLAIIVVYAIVMAGLLIINHTEAQTPKINCENAVFCSKDDEDSPLGEIQPEINKEEKCNNFIKNEPKLKKARCDDIIKVLEAFDYDKTITAIIIYESGFSRSAVNYNKDKTGKVWSSDHGVMQLNNHYHGVLDGNIETSISKAKKCIKDNGLDCWSSYTSGKYKQELSLAQNLINNLK